MRTILMALIGGVLLVFAVVADASARAWTVEQDGSGDWVTIQGAVDVAAAGDTILIGPGRYDQYQPVTMTIVDLNQAPGDLHFVGAGVDAVIIGGTVYQFGQSGFFFRQAGPYSFEGMTFESMSEPIGYMGGFTINNCKFVDVTGAAITYQSSTPILMTNCVIEGRAANPNDNMALGVKSCPSVIMENCVITDMALYFEGVADYRITDSQFPATNFRTCVNSVDSNGLLTGNTFWSKVGIQGGTMVLRGNEFFAEGPQDIDNFEAAGGHVILEGNVLHGGYHNNALFIQGGTAVEGSGNHFLNSGASPYTVELWYGMGADRDLRNNYWGTSDRTQIEAWIYDGNDDPNSNVRVLFDPYSGAPLPAENTSWGSVKALFR